jgi:hypothetical protein
MTNDHIELLIAKLASKNAEMYNQIKSTPMFSDISKVKFLCERIEANNKLKYSLRDRLDS